MLTSKAFQPTCRYQTVNPPLPPRRNPVKADSSTPPTVQAVMAGTVKGASVRRWLVMNVWKTARSSSSNF